jgi:glycosyltransferase involved in cell wall biosynthesis
MAKICLMTPGQPSTNPRLVKEADTLQQAGHKVHVLCSHMIDWADEADKRLLASREWTCSYVGGERNSWTYKWTRLRHGLVRRVPGAWHAGTWLGDRALTRVTPELLAAAEAYKADLYIAHYAGALAAAMRAAKKNGGYVAFDAEDFESGYYVTESGPGKLDRLVEDVERKYLGECLYVTAASPGIAAAYRTKYHIPLPTGILNVFPLSERPCAFRETTLSGPLRLHWFSQTIGPGRGLEDVIRAMAKLTGHQIELHLRGMVRLEYWEQLLNLVKTEGLLPRRLSLRGPCAPGELIREAAEFDVGLALEQPASLNKRLCASNKLFSYLLAGNAIAATVTEGQTDILQTIGKAGFLFPAGNVDALAEGLCRWAENREQLHEARRQAWFWGSRSFNWDLEKKKFLSVVSEVLSEQECVKNAC